MYAIDCENVVKEYKNGVRALNGLSISVKSGEIFSLLGENGAGKSTLISILTTFLKCTSGSVSLFDKSADSEPQKIRNEIACVAQNVSVDKHLSLKENMLFQSRLYKIPKREAMQRMEQLIISFDLERYTTYPVSSYSGGVKRRLDIALNMMSNPKILFLDEPTVGMDVQSRMAMWEMMKKIRDDFGTTIFLTTHYLEEAEELSDTICIIKDGKEILQGTPLELKRFIGNSTLRIKFADNMELKTAKQAIKKFYQDKPIRTEQNNIIVDNIGALEDLTAITVFMSKTEIPFIGVEITLPTLQDVFIRLTSGEELEVKE